MSEPKKFTEEEVKGLREIQDKYVAIQNDFGTLSVQRLRVENSLNQIDEAYSQLSEEFTKTQKTEKDYVDKITEKYGDGTLNIEDGTFIPKEK